MTSTIIDYYDHDIMLSNREDILRFAYDNMIGIDIASYEMSVDIIMNGSKLLGCIINSGNEYSVTYPEKDIMMKLSDYKDLGIEYDTLISMHTHPNNVAVPSYEDMQIYFRNRIEYKNVLKKYKDIILCEFGYYDYDDDMVSIPLHLDSITFRSIIGGSLPNHIHAHVDYSNSEICMISECGNYLNKNYNKMVHTNPRWEPIKPSDMYIGKYIWIKDDNILSSKICTWDEYRKLEKIRLSNLCKRLDLEEKYKSL